MTDVAHHSSQQIRIKNHFLSLPISRFASNDNPPPDAIAKLITEIELDRLFLQVPTSFQLEHKKWLYSNQLSSANCGRQLQYRIFTKAAHASPPLLLTSLKASKNFCMISALSLTPLSATFTLYRPLLLCTWRSPLFGNPPSRQKYNETSFASDRSQQIPIF